MSGESDGRFRNAAEFHRHAVAWARALVTRQIERARAAGLVRPSREGAGAPTQAEVLLRASRRVDDLERTLWSRTQELEDGVLPFMHLATRFGLSPEEARLLLLLAVVSADARVRQMIGFLQGDRDRNWPTAGLALTALSAEDDASRLDWSLLDPNGRLRSHHLVDLGEAFGGVGLLERGLGLPDAVAAFVTGGTLWVDETVAEYAGVLEPTSGFDALLWPEGARPRVEMRLLLSAARVLEFDESAGVVLRGGPGCGKRTTALALCHKIGLRLLAIDASRLPGQEERASLAVRTLLRDARLHSAIPYFERAEALGGDATAGARLAAVTSAFARDVGLYLFATTNEHRIEVERALSLPDVVVPAPTRAQRVALWHRALPDGDDGDERAVALADRFPATPGTIALVARDATARARVDPTPLGEAALGRLVLDRSRHNLRTIASEVRVYQDWDDLVLPEDVIDRCQRIVQYAQGRGRLAEEWGFGAKLLVNRGTSALFSGPPGTGKTMVAGLIARTLGVDAYRIDISQILSKWVGETEKNLGQLFDEAARTRTVLVFDEADALFSKRTDVKNASDRYSNVEVNYLLQRMESFEGVIVLTTNLEKSIDKAFVRRIHFKIRFPEPTVEERAEMWRRMVPPEVSLGDDVDLGELARRFEVTGGFIRNAVIRAGLLALTAAPDGKRILTHRAMLQAIREELEEAGRLTT